LLALAGGVAALLAVAVNPADARSAAAQDWPPFVLVAGLLLIGLVADGDGLFAAAGHRLAMLAPNGASLYVGAVVLVALVTAVLNLDSAVAFLTPVLVYTARSRGAGDTALLYACLMVSNAGSLLLPGSNLTNLIVLGHLHLTGGAFAARMAPAWVAAVLVTALVVGLVERRSLRSGGSGTGAPDHARIGLGLAAVLAASVLVVTLGSPALPVAAVGATAVGIRVFQRQQRLERVRQVLGLSTLLGLFGVAVALGAAGRAWSGTADLLAQLGPWPTAGLGALTSVVVNNLPAASLLAARVPPHPFALLVGLNLGPNLFVTGSLAWVLWLRTARAAGASPSIATASRLGLLVVPLSMAAALGALAVTSPL
jgi:arsenical pump membrane protein